MLIAIKGTSTILAWLAQAKIVHAVSVTFSRVTAIGCTTFVVASVHGLCTVVLLAVCRTPAAASRTITRCRSVSRCMVLPNGACLRLYRCIICNHCVVRHQLCGPQWLVVNHLTSDSAFFCWIQYFNDVRQALLYKLYLRPRTEVTPAPRLLLAASC
jgi:hypothetical protein